MSLVWRVFPAPGQFQGHEGLVPIFIDVPVDLGRLALSLIVRN